MPYATLPDMIARYGEREIIQLTDCENPRTDAVVEAVLNQALSDAAAEADGYLAVRHTLPLPSTPPVLVRIVCDIARYRLYDEKASEEVRNRYTDAIKWLLALSRGAASLGLPADVTSPAAGAVIVSASRAFSRDKLRGF